ncbi:acetylserotonin O-methyltransferase [Streptomyces sp. NBC_01433]|uniref:methyltransferase n=1 Tax=Streptomyces sp. NBC_01433 TaxID=2903864 RepID=UPI00224F8CD5|nr:methyltransferase [Streptomyces sp. NBC_01433]MCX4681211.1 acetylserotonin O-methyltransferase [Streptomyces sp. NBC_01433]
MNPSADSDHQPPPNPPVRGDRNAVDPVVERFHFLVNAPALFNAVVTALEWDLFGMLAKHPGASFEELRRATGVPAHSLRVLLHAVCTTGLLERQADGAYHNAPAADELLVPDGPDSWRHILTGWKEIYYPAFTRMSEALAAGTNTALAAHPGDEPTLYRRLSHNPELETVFHRSMSAFTLKSLDSLVECEEFATVRHLLDVGGGDGTTSEQLIARHPGLRSTIFDIPSVSQLAAEHNTAGEADRERIALHPGDLFADPFPAGADAVLFSHVLEIFSGEQITELLTKAYSALPSGGRVFVYGYNVSDDETRGWYSARLSLYLNVLASGQGMAYPARDYEEWARRAGFTGVRTLTDHPYEHGLTIGTKA